MISGNGFTTSPLERFRFRSPRGAPHARESLLGFRHSLTQDLSRGCQPKRDVCGFRYWNLPVPQAVWVRRRTPSRNPRCERDPFAIALGWLLAASAVLRSRKSAPVRNVDLLQQLGRGNRTCSKNSGRSGRSGWGSFYTSRTFRVRSPAGHLAAEEPLAGGLNWPKSKGLLASYEIFSI